MIDTTLPDGARLTLRRPQPSDVEALAAWPTGTARYRYAARGILPRTRLRIEREVFRPQTVNTETFGIDVSDRLIGLLKVADISWRKRTGHVRYVIGDPVYAGKGFCTAAVTLGITYAFDVLGLRSLFAHVHEDNIASIRVLEKCGFRSFKCCAGHYRAAPDVGAWMPMEISRRESAMRQTRNKLIYRLDVSAYTDTAA